MAKVAPQDDITVDEYLNVLVAEAAYACHELNAAMKTFNVGRKQRREILKYVSKPIDYEYERVTHDGDTTDFAEV